MPCSAIAAGLLVLACPLITDGQQPEEPERDPSAQKLPVTLHTVEEGETVRSIAALYEVSPETVMIANALEDPDLLRVAQVLVVPSRDGVLYTVASGDTLRSVAELYGVDLGELIAANELSASPDVVPVGTVLVVPGAKPLAHVQQPERDNSSADQPAAVVEPQPPPAASPGGSVGAADAPSTYTVRDGDTLRSIAEGFGLDILSLIAVNSLADPDLLTPGSVLRTSSADTLEHTVEAGETLANIAWRYSVDSSVLLVANGLVDPDLILPGMVLVIPDGKPPAAPPLAPPTVGASTPAPAVDSPDVATPAPRPPTPAPVPRSPAGERLTSARVTGYALGAGAVSTRTASGTLAHWGTVAADTHLYPFGTRLRIEGFDDMVFVVEDTGGAVRGNLFDVWFPDAASARGLGARTRQVTILPPPEQ